MRTAASSTCSLSMPGTRSTRAATRIESSPIFMVNSASTLSISGCASSSSLILALDSGSAASPISWPLASRPSR